jgi:hypothetical protein
MKIRSARSTIAGLVFVLLLLSAAATAASGAGPVTGEVEVAYWDSETEVEVGRETESLGSRGPAFRGRVRIGGWSVKAAWHRLERGRTDLTRRTTLVNIDVTHDVISVARNTYLALGGGWERIRFEEGGQSATTSGPRLSLDGRIGLAGMVYAYGEGALYPWLSDSEIDILGELGIGLREAGGYEWELGVGVEPIPFLLIKAGYRVSTVDFDLLSGGDRLGSADFAASGFLLSVGAHF